MIVLGIIGLLLVMGASYLITQSVKWGKNFNGIQSAQASFSTPVTDNSTTNPTPHNSNQIVVNNSINLPPPIASAGLPMANLTPGITLTPSETKSIPLTPGSI